MTPPQALNEGGAGNQLTGLLVPGPCSLCNCIATCEFFSLFRAPGVQWRTGRCSCCLTSTCGRVRTPGKTSAAASFGTECARCAHT
eukprot:3985284-Pyramimonas_sp.AAC.1